MAIEYIVVQDATGTQRKVAVDLFNTDEFAQVMKVAHGADGVVTLVETAAPLPVKQTHGKIVSYGKIDALTSGDNVLVAGVAGQKVKLIGITVVVANPVTLQLKSATVAETGQRVLSGSMAFSANGGWQDRGRVDEYLTECDTAKSLVLNLSSGVQVSGYFSFVQE